MSEYGVVGNDSNGRRLFDSRTRSWEAIAWGTVEATAYVPFSITAPTNIDFPMIFLKYMNGNGFCVRGKRFAQTRTQWFVSSTTRSIPYVVCGFRTDGNMGGGYGIAAIDNIGRCCFSTSHAYIRPNFPANLYGAYNYSNDVYSYWNLQTTPTYTANTYMWWPTTWSWDKDGSNSWDMGLLYGYHPTMGIDGIFMQRIEIPHSLNGAPWYLGSTGNAYGPGVLNQFPFIANGGPMIIEFFPPS